jgi:hypothetical protein
MQALVSYCRLLDEVPMLQVSIALQWHDSVSM